MVIDFHTHCFPDALAPRAMGQLTDTISAMNITPHTDGTADGLLRSMHHHGIHRSVICNIATNARQMHKVNDFAIYLKETHGDELIPLGSIHPHAEDPAAELARLKAAGICGIKLHPDYMSIDFDHPNFDPILGLCEASNVFVITHAGFDPLSPNHLHCTPAMVRRVMDRHPQLKLVVAHMGGMNCEEEALSLLCGQNIYLDTSLLTYRPNKEKLMYKILLSHHPDRLLFATDTPWTDAGGEMEAIKRAPLSEEMKRKIFFENALNLLRSCHMEVEGTS